MPDAALTRRGFLGLTAATVAGCGGEDSVAQRRGGRARALFASGVAKETLDPHVQSLFVDIARHKAMFDKLVELGPDLKAIPRLAEKWQPNRDATVWRFSLRPALFHNGKKLTGADVLFSLARIHWSRHCVDWSTTASASCCSVMTMTWSAPSPTTSS